MTAWQPIGSYPRCETCSEPDCDWGPEALLLVPHEHGPHPYVGHKEAGMWLVRDSEHPSSWGELFIAPTHWARLPEQVSA